MDIIAGVGVVLLVLLGLSLVVTIHEAGHFFAARWAGVEVEAFAIGWGKVLWAKKFGATEFRLCLLPLGGYCKMRGEQDLAAALQNQSDEVEASPGSLFAAPAWKRIVISAAGPLFNLITAFLVFIVLAATGVPSSGPSARILLSAEIGGRADTPAQQAGLQSKDLVLAVDSKPVRNFLELQTKIVQAGTSSMTWKVERNGVPLEISLAPRYDAEAKRPLVGITSYNEPIVRAVAAKSAAGLAGFLPGDRIVSIDGANVEADQVVISRLTQSKTVSHDVVVERRGSQVKLLYISEGPQQPHGLAFVTPTYPAVGMSVDRAIVVGSAKASDLLGLMVGGLVALFTGKVNPVESLSGPIGVIGDGSSAVSSAFDLGWEFGLATTTQFLAFLSLALFLMNLLPIPALDGGSIVVSIIEGLRKKRLGLKSLMRYQQIGAVIVLALILFTIPNDLIRMFGRL